MNFGKHTVVLIPVLNVASETSVKWDKFKSTSIIKSRSKKIPFLEILVCQDEVSFEAMICALEN